MPAIIASNVAISAATSANNREKAEAKTFNCTRTTESFDSKTATLEQKQKYAECVQYLLPVHPVHPVHPVKTDQDVVLYKVAAILFLVSCLGAFIYMFETRRKASCRYKIDYVLMPVGFGMLVTALVGLFAFAIAVLFS